MISLCSGVTLVEIISVFGCFLKINTSLVFQNRGAGLARNRLCGRPKEGGRNTKAKLAIKQELFSVLLSGYTVFWCNRSNTKPQRTVHQLFQNKSERQICNMLHICHPDRKRRNPVLTAVLKLCHPRHPFIALTQQQRQPYFWLDR